MLSKRALFNGAPAKCISKCRTLAVQHDIGTYTTRRTIIRTAAVTEFIVAGVSRVPIRAFSATRPVTTALQWFGLTCSVGADTRNLDYTRRPIRHPVRDIRRRCRIRFVCTRRPTATELVSAGHRLMAVLRRVETPRPLKNDKKKSK
jgi:hypothetical protein